MATMEPLSPTAETPGDADDAVYPCKGCGEVLEEGKAFELAGNRWHIDCFRCNTCGTILDSESNLLLLGDGSLICNNCTYSCSACGNKIEDLAILTGEQAFCASCFKCRNCKRKIDNLRYARTSQGIFCMQCHESLMARRRKKASRDKTRAPSGTTQPSGTRKDKTLPALPGSGDATSPSVPTPSDSYVGSPPIDERSPPAQSSSQFESQKENVTLPPSTYSDGRTPAQGAGNDIYIPVALDPGSSGPTKSGAREYAGDTRAMPSAKNDYGDLVGNTTGSRSGSGDRGQRSRVSPHIAYQEKGREASSDMADTIRRRMDTGSPASSTAASPPVAGYDRSKMTPLTDSYDPESRDFKLQDAPKNRESKESGNSPSMALSNQTDGSPMLEQGVTASPPINDFADSGSKNKVTRKEVPRPESETQEALRRVQQASSTPTDLPPRSTTRPSVTSKDDFTTPREAPQPPAHRPNESINSIQSDRFQTRDPSTPVIDTPADASVGDDLYKARDEDDEHPGLFRKVSKAVRHGRSHSDKAVTGSPKWPRTPRNGSIDISSPITSSVDPKEEVVQLRNKLRFSQQRVAELEADKMALEEKVNGTVDIRQVNTELREKRSTMAFLDTQREMVIRELEVMTEHLTKAKDAKEPLNIDDLKSELLKDFATSLHKLKDTLSTQIEDLVHKKNELTNEISNLIQMKDKGFQEFESLSTKNTQLAELNNQLVHNIQEMYKQGREPSTTPVNGLGIYSNYVKDKSNASMDGRSALSTDPSQYSGDTQVDPDTVLSAPKIVNIRKDQPKKFNWKKGAKNVSKGFKGAFSTQPSNIKEEQFSEGMAYNDMPAGENPTLVTTLPRQTNDKQSWGFLGGSQKASTLKPGMIQREPSTSSVASLPASEAVFGSDLTARCEFEKRVLPAVVTRCAEEVELRGMDQEGVYRKSGSSIQVKKIQEGFEKDFATYDISDEDLDIHAVTSALKQYFRKLPTPLIPFDAYDSLLDCAKEMSEKERIEKLAQFVETLPRAHRDCLEYLIQHLARVTERESENLMTPLNVAVVFAPTIMRPAIVEREMTDMQIQRQAVQYLLELNKSIFPA